VKWYTFTFKFKSMHYNGTVERLRLIQGLLLFFDTRRKFTHNHVHCLLVE